MSSMPLFHVSHVVSGSMLGPRTTTYLRIVATDAPNALAIAQRAIRTAGGDPEVGDWSVSCAGSVANDDSGVLVARAA